MRVHLLELDMWLWRVHKSQFNGARLRGHQRYMLRALRCALRGA